MELEIIAIAFLFAYLMLQLQLPSLVGFLTAGFALHAFGYTSTPVIESIANIGVTLLLFTIGLKLDVRSLLNKEIWLGASIHNLLTTLLFSLSLIGLKWLGLSIFSDFATKELLLISFALSFSSTVFAIKALQERGEIHSTYGILAIGVLIMQDLFAVIFLTVISGKMPGIEALILFTLPLMRPSLYRLLDKVGHGDVLLLFGVFLALVMGAGLFELVGMKADLGALMLGILMSFHPRASELAKSLFNIKELFLVCFFLNIGLSEKPTTEGFIIALCLLALLPIKGLLYYLIFSLFHFRTRTSLFASLSLFNYSEFGLIVGGIAYKMEMIPGSMLVGIAIAVSLSFIIAALLNTNNNTLYGFFNPLLTDPEPDKTHPQDRLINLGHIHAIVLGMGRIGSSAYDELTIDFKGKIIGIEARKDTVTDHIEQGRNVIHADATDSDFWSRMTSLAHLELILLTMPNSQANIVAMEQIRQFGYKGKVAAIVKYEDEREQLEALGVNAAHNIYKEAGTGFAYHIREQVLDNSK